MREEGIFRWNIEGIMEAFEFEAMHKNGMIKIPDELKNLTKKIKIIILTEEKCFKQIVT